ncbi:hypothetical protein CA600_16120 [Paenibacillus sp. VTT E-133280]|uniref:hypothetical protein n=1 Tax=Paenibacillus sp. VTT E-133280 TaxID=1986222 RepID=UPI000BA0760E|nr:hypothetical protein [Paenibacillus sp. VTT E-133280]OZQ64743.1 hypothetical protein CA600_16120 [Paenibacillus sp. VTT E-133280]
MRVVKHIMLWFVSTILFTLATFGLELWKGNKISTAEYYGVQNIGFVFIFLAFLFSAVLYPIIIFPFSWVVHKSFGIAGTVYVLVDYYLDQRS